VDTVVDWAYMPTRSGDKFFSGASTIVVCIDFVVGRDDGCCIIWTTGWQGSSFISRLVSLINLNKARSAF